MGSAQARATTTKQHGTIFGNYYNEDVVLPDLEVGPEGTKQAIKFTPGEVRDLSRFFETKELDKSLSLDLALTKGWLKSVENMDVDIDVPIMSLPGGIAPPNDFDRKLKEELLKEKAEEDRLREGRDGLASRVKDL